MSIVAKEGSTRTLLPAEMLQAVCYGVVDLGTQTSQFGAKRKICVLWEIPSIRFETEEGEDLPKVKSKTYTLSLHEKANLCKDLVSWRGKPFTPDEKKGFDITNLIGANCLLQIVHEIGNDGTTYDNIATVTPLMKGMEKLSPENEILEYSIEDDKFDFPENMYDWLVNKVKDSLEYNASETQTEQSPPQAAVGSPDYGSGVTDEIPF